jgi:hypothetical protein
MTQVDLSGAAVNLDSLRSHSRIELADLLDSIRARTNRNFSLFISIEIGFVIFDRWQKGARHRRRAQRPVEFGRRRRIAERSSSNTKPTAVLNFSLFFFYFSTESTKSII